jgi:hypothetical protein
MRPHLRPLLLLTLLGLVFFHPLVLHPGWILYAEHSDFPDLHIPAKRFLVRSVHETGELPLWDPYQLCGAPFVHDIQVGMFYPPHAVLYLLPEELVGPALSWLVVFHVILAGWLMYAYAHDLGLREAGALVAAVGWMFAGRWMLHLLAGGHYIVIGLAWLPLLLLCLERAIRRGSLGWATAGGVVYALVILGTHPQWTLYASLLVLLWTPAAALERAGWWGSRPGDTAPLSVHRVLGRWLLFGTWVVLVGVLLTAVQLLPTAEAAGEAMRAGGVGPSGALQGGLRSLVFLLGPSLTTTPHNLEWEDRGGLTLLWLAAAVTAALAGHGRVRYVGALGLALAVFAAGGSILVQGLPPFRLFRQPPRMFVVVGFPVALLAGYATDMLQGSGPTAARALELARRVLPRAVAAVLILVGVYGLRSLYEGRPLRGHVYWISLIATLPIGLTLLPRLQRCGRAAAFAWGGLLLADLWALTWPSVNARAESQLYGPPACVIPLLGRPAADGRIIDRCASEAFPLGCGACLARVWRLEAVRGYNPLDYRRFKEYLQLASGSDSPVQPQDGPLGFPVLGDFTVNEKNLIDLLNVRHLLMPADEPPAPPAWGKPVGLPAGPGVFNFVPGGNPPLPRYVLYDNPAALPRAFVVFHAAALPSREHLLDRLRQTDFRREVLLEEDITPCTPPPYPLGRPAVIRSYLPNRVEVTVADGPAGWLVLADPWYPGWRCAIDGRHAPLLRANFLVRAVAVPTGEHTVTFSFEPVSYRIGRLMSLGAVAAVGMLFGVHGIRQLRRRGRPTTAATAPAPVPPR